MRSSNQFVNSWGKGSSAWHSSPLRPPFPTTFETSSSGSKPSRASVGLDFFPTIFEVLSYDQMNEIAAYGGFPTRYPHWRWGMDYERLSKSHEYGLSKIYELVINNNPAIAYLLEGNSLVDQKLVMAHVYAHVDFFKNNFCFRMTSQGREPRGAVTTLRKWIDTMANQRLRSCASGPTASASKKSSSSSTPV